MGSGEGVRRGALLGRVILGPVAMCFLQSVQTRSGEIVARDQAREIADEAARYALRHPDDDDQERGDADAPSRSVAARVRRLFKRRINRSMASIALGHELALSSDRSRTGLQCRPSDHDLSASASCTRGPELAASSRRAAPVTADNARSTGRAPARSLRCARGSCRSSRRRSGHPASRSQRHGRRVLLGRLRRPRCRRAPAESRRWV